MLTHLATTPHHVFDLCRDLEALPAAYVHTVGGYTFLIAATYLTRA
jgi:hypothetical protein